MGDERHDGLTIPGRVVLAHEPSFCLGRLTISPATRQVSCGKQSQTLEPRVMQVLVVLARADGDVVTRDQLIECCWDGRIVGEDAVNRALSRIRRVGTGIGENSFSVETITKVGYRLRIAASEFDEPAGVLKVGQPSPPWLSRRTAIAGTAVAAGAAALGMWKGLVRSSGYTPMREAKQLYANGTEARLAGTPDGLAQSEAYFREAVELDPNYADAWGMLALATVYRLELEREDRLQHVATGVRAAANRALALDSTQAEAHVALAAIPSQFRHWSMAEARLLSQLKGSSALPVLKQLAPLYADVARWNDAIAAYRRIRDAEPFHPGPSIGIAVALWAAGDPAQAEAETRKALQRWPRHPGVWSTRMMILTYGGKPEAAAAFAADPEHHSHADNDVIALRKLTAEAIATRDPGIVLQAKAKVLESVPKHFQNIRPAFRLFAALGEVEEAFELLNAYYFRRGRYARPEFRPISALTRIDTDFLFHPPSRILWADKRFDALTRAIGLDAYWRTLGFVPSHRRP